ncbi:MAG TPA: histone deacetylase [Thermoplasmata archaeon]|nr:histone deacetylase [Thermoplasmata archaeon]
MPLATSIHRHPPPPYFQRGPPPPSPTPLSPFPDIPPMCTGKPFTAPHRYHPMDVVFHPRFLEHQQYPGHPERPERLSIVLGALARADLDPPLHEPEAVPEDLLLKVHQAEHVRRLESIGEGYYDPDTFVRPDTLEIARLAAGAGVLAVDIARREGAAFALVRPPGHHAGAGYAGGFCYLNNIAIAAEHALGHAQRVAIVDIDVHHGNGTADLFSSRGDVLYISTHQRGIFPGTGRPDEVGTGDGEGYTVNIALPGGCGDVTLRGAFDRLVMPILAQHDTGILLVSLGVDAHYTDMLANLGVSTPGYLGLVRRLHAFAADRSIGIAFFLEGGYSLHAMAEVVGNTIALDMDGEVPIEHDGGFDDRSGIHVIERVAEIHSAYWDL